MCRSMLPMRPIIADRRIRPALDRFGVFLLVFVVLLALLRQVECKEISSVKRIPKEFVNSNSTEKDSSSISRNEIILDNSDGDDVYLGYSGYLRGNSSMLESKFHTYNDNILSSANDTSFKSAKATHVGHRRIKRGVTHLYNMILCATGCNPLAYKGYGCYCGFLGSGYPMDGIDRCCKMHDWCYDATECPMFVEYFVPYYWKCYRGYKPICAIEHGEWGSSGSCAQRLCECDRSFAECLRRYRCPRHKAVCTSSPWRLIQNIFMII